VLKTFALVSHCASEKSVSPADEGVPLDLANRKRFDRRPHYLFYALSCELMHFDEGPLTHHSLSPTQLGRRRSQGTSFFSKNAVSKIVRLTVETNLLTSAQILNSGTLPSLTSSFSHRDNYGLGVDRRKTRA
jgi:hypothetical protein